MEELLRLAKEYENQILSRKQAMGVFGTSRQKEHIQKYGRIKNVALVSALTKTLNQIFETVDDTIKVGRGKGYKLGKARTEATERDKGKLATNGIINEETILKNKKDFLSKQHTYSEHEDEEWLPVGDPDFSLFYYVSNYGKVFSLKSNRVLKSSKGSQGYLVTTFSGEKIKEKGMLVHRLVALTFIENPDPENLIIVNHIDGNKSNPYYKNLEWVTPKENSWHAMRTGLRRYGETREKHYKPKPLTVEVVNEREAIKKVEYRKSHLPVSLLSNLRNKEMDTNHFRSVI